MAYYADDGRRCINEKKLKEVKKKGRRQGKDLIFIIKYLRKLFMSLENS